jgi:nucleotide-binding universal stress UspA family protein
MSTTFSSSCDRIIIAIDGSQAAAWAVQFGSQLARQLSAQVMLVYVIEPITTAGDNVAIGKPAEATEQQLGKNLLERARASFPSCVRVDTSVRTGFPADQIAAVARDWKADLLVIGTRGRGQVAQFDLGTTAKAVISQSACPVMTVAHEPHQLPTKTDNGVSVSAHGAEPITVTSVPIASRSGGRDCDWADGESTVPEHVVEVL